MSNRDQENLDHARLYIQQHNYTAAKSILKKMPKNPTAQQWLAKIDEIERRTAPVKKKRGMWVKGMIGCVIIGTGLVAFGVIGSAIGILPDTNATQSAKEAEQQAARSTQAIIEGMTLTIIALTPSDTPTETPTATITFTPSPGLTSQGVIQNTLPPTWTPVPTRTPAPAFVPDADSDLTTRTRYTTEEVNVRNGPGTDYERIGSLPAGYRIRVLGEQNGWYELSFNNGTGWVAGQYTSVSQPPPVVNNDNSATAVPSCDCYGRDLDCSDFASHAQAQACFNYCMAQRGSDIFQLDGEDDDGLACEILP